MASKIFKQIFERQIAQFVGLYSEDSTAIFKDERDRLIHPGEYGRYREESCKELLRLLFGKEVGVSEGFVITADNQISTQCDIIVYNSNVSPFIADGIAKMFPAEEVRMIGEIKSTLSKREFVDALRKMAENKKKIVEGRKNDGVCQYQREAKTYDTIASFLICNKLDFAFDKLEYSEIYSGIDRKYWHNSILSLEDASLSYLLRFSNFPEKVREELEKNGVNTNALVFWQYPVFTFGNISCPVERNCIRICNIDKYAHIKQFFVELSICSKEVWLYNYDPVTYLGMEVDLFGTGESC